MREKNIRFLYDTTGVEHEDEAKPFHYVWLRLSIGLMFVIIISILLDDINLFYITSFPPLFFTTILITYVSCSRRLGDYLNNNQLKGDSIDINVPRGFDGSRDKMLINPPKWLYVIVIGSSITPGINSMMPSLTGFIALLTVMSGFTFGLWLYYHRIERKYDVKLKGYPVKKHLAEQMND